MKKLKKRTIYENQLRYYASVHNVQCELRYEFDMNIIILWLHAWSLI